MFKLVNPFTKLLYTCKALSHTLVKCGFVELILKESIFFPLFFSPLCNLYKKNEGQMNRKESRNIGRSAIKAALQNRPLSNISPSEKWVKKIQAAAYNGAGTVFWWFC